MVEQLQKEYESMQFPEPQPPVNLKEFNAYWDAKVGMGRTGAQVSMVDFEYFLLCGHDRAGAYPETAIVLSCRRNRFDRFRASVCRAVGLSQTTPY